MVKQYIEFLYVKALTGQRKQSDSLIVGASHDDIIAGFDKVADLASQLL